MKKPILEFQRLYWLIGVYNTDWRIYRVAKLKNRPPHLPHTRLAQDLILLMQGPYANIVVANVGEFVDVMEGGCFYAAMSKL